MCALQGAPDLKQGALEGSGASIPLHESVKFRFDGE
jgi:hypothetical protein